MLDVYMKISLGKMQWKGQNAVDKILTTEKLLVIRVS